MAIKKTSIISGYPERGYYYFYPSAPFSMAINFYGALVVNDISVLMPGTPEMDECINQNPGLKAYRKNPIKYENSSFCIIKEDGIYHQKDVTESNKPTVKSKVTIFEGGQKSAQQEEVMLYDWVKEEESLYYYWFEFLRLHKKYKVFCEILREVNARGGDDYKFASLIRTGNITYRSFEHNESCNQWMWAAKKLREAELFEENEPELFDKRIYINDLANTYMYFGDVHSVSSFYDWWTGPVNLIDSEAQKDHNRHIDMIDHICRGAYLFANWGRPLLLTPMSIADTEKDVQTINFKISEDNKRIAKFLEGTPEKHHERIKNEMMDRSGHRRVRYVKIDPKLSLDELELQLRELSNYIKKEGEAADHKLRRPALLKPAKNDKALKKMPNLLEAFKLKLENKEIKRVQMGYRLNKFYRTDESNEAQKVISKNNLAANIDNKEIRKYLGDHEDMFKKRGRRDLATAKKCILNSTLIYEVPIKTNERESSYQGKFPFSECCQ